MDLKLFPDNSVQWERQFPTGDDNVLRLKAQEIRREHTGLHAQISIGFRDMLLAYDTFNVGRDEDRRRLVKSAHKYLKNGMADAYPDEVMRHDLDMFCRLLPQVWEQQRFSLQHYNVDEAVPDATFVLKPYLLEGGGTLFYGPPESGKTYIALAMAASIAAGIKTWWGVERRPVLYVNLERSAVSMQRRFYYLARALGIKGTEHSLQFLHCRGQSFKSLTKRVLLWRSEHPDGVGWIDSISRSGEGSMVKDDVANAIIDWANLCFDTWGGIGHTPRGDAEHVFGSVHFDAGEDIGVQVLSDKKPNGDVGIMLTVTKRNDTPDPPVQCFLLHFEGMNLASFTKGRTGDFGTMVLATEKKVKPLDKLIDWVLEQSEACATATEAWKATGINRGDVSTFFGKSNCFQRHHKVGRDVYYCVTDKARAEREPF